MENIAGNGAQPAIREQEWSDTGTGKQIGAAVIVFWDLAAPAAVVLAVSPAAAGS